MSRTNLKDRIKQGPLILDGAMGTQLITRGIQAGACNEYLNIDSAGIISDIHNAYLLAKLMGLGSGHDKELVFALA